jgi:hypothetical protein
MQKHIAMLTPLIALIVISLTLWMQHAYSDGFKLERIGTHDEPKIYGRSVTLPDTSIRAGIYLYQVDDKRVDDGIGQGRLGFMIGTDNFFYVDSTYYSLSDTNYGLYGNYFVIDGWGWGSTSGHDRLMLLCQFDKVSVKLLDVIGIPYIEKIGMDFVSFDIDDAQDKSKPVETLESRLTRVEPSRIAINDIDHNGMSEIKLKMLGYDFFLYLEIANDKLRVNLNPALYTPLFVAENKRLGNSKNKSYAYYFYGFLAKKLDLKTIGLALKHHKEQSKGIDVLLRNIEKWNDEFHRVYGERFEMKQYLMNRPKGSASRRPKGSASQYFLNNHATSPSY